MNHWINIGLSWQWFTIRTYKIHRLAQLKIVFVKTSHHLPVVGDSLTEGGPGVLVLHPVGKLCDEVTPWGGEG